ncbi:hypothetical protein ACKVMT_07075 [Halobacteriales archaeon Cl-PHB]
MAPTKLNPVETVRNFTSNYDGIGGALRAGVGGIIVTLLAGIAILVNTGRRLITDPLDSVINGVSNLMGAIIGGAGDIVRQGAETTVATIAPGATWAVGPLTYAFSIASIGVGLYVLAQIVEMRSTSNILPFTFTDLPVIGATEEGEE